MKRRVILCDIDHTISDANWREHLSGEKSVHEDLVDITHQNSWDAFNAAAANDKPHLDVIEFLNHLSKHYTMVALTARPEKWRKVSLDWLVKHRVHIDKLIMRPEGDFRPSPLLKVELVKLSFPDLSRVAFIIDDREDVVTAFKGANITCLHVFPRRV